VTGEAQEKIEMGKEKAVAGPEWKAVSEAEQEQSSNKPTSRQAVAFDTWAAMLK
jgi:hypothetical protein